MRAAIFLAVLAVLAVTSVAQQVIAKKEFVSVSNGLYKIRVSYRKGSGGLVSDVRIRDSLPEHLELVNGRLDVEGPNVRFFACGARDASARFAPGSVLFPLFSLSSFLKLLSRSLFTGPADQGRLQQRL